MQIVTGRRGEPHVTSRQMQAVYRSFLGDFALLDIGEKLRAEAYSNDIVRVYDGVVSVQGIYAVIAYNQYDEVYIDPVSVGKKRIDTIVLHYTKDSTHDVEDMQLDVVQGEEYTDNPIAPVVPEGGDAWEGTTDIQVPIYDVEVTNFGLTVTPYARMLNLIPTLESIAERIPETVVTGIKGDSEVLYRDGDVNITKANIGLGNVDNTADTDKPISTATQTALNGKVDKVAGKGLSTEDYTTTDKTKLAGISEGATQTIANPADTATETLSKLEVGGVVYDVPQGASGATELSELTDVNLTDVENNNILQYDETANKWKNSNALQGSKTATGNPLTIEDAAPVNAVNLSMDLEPIQDLHGYANPWVGGAGKNKSSINDCNASASTDLNTQPISIGSERNYTISMKLMRINGVTVDNPNLYAFRVNEYDSTDTIINIINSNIQFLSDNIEVSFSQTVTLDSNTAYIIITYGNFNGDCNINTHKYDIQAEEGSTATSFAPYTNICPISGRTEEVITQKDNPTNPTVTKTYTIQLGQDVYGGTLDVTRGKMVVTHKGVVYDGSSDENWDGSAQIHGISIDSIYSIDQVPMANCFKGVSPRIHSSLKIGELALNPSLMAINVYYSISGLNNWKSYLASNPLQVVYELAEPFTIDLTPQQIKMLENTNTIYTDYESDTITLEYQPNNAIGEAVRAVEESYDPEFAVRPVLKKKAFSGTTDSDGAVTLINASDIPSGHKIIPLHITDMTIGGSAGTYFVEYKPYNSGDSVKGYCYTYFNGSQITPVGTVVTGNFYYYELEV